ncbi:MAG: carboxypeptidase regulatory-like domain-containing protein, partial [Myxococcales bacterium]|nr:carboxypeptidase regulatory-like domain-containing protein [Myxococcales bacterium]
VRALSSGASPTEISATVEQDRLRRFSGRMAAPTAPAPGPGGGADPSFIPRGELGVMVGPIPPLPPPGVQIAVPAAVVATSGVMAPEPAPFAIDPARGSLWTTGPDGVYRIRGLGKGKVSVLAVAAGYAEGRSREIGLEPGQTLTKVDIVLSPGTILVGRVTDQHGVPVLGAQVSAKPELGAQLDAFTDEVGGYRLGPLTGQVDLRATAYGHGDANRRLELAGVKGATPAEQREDLVLVVADAVLAGTLDDTSGAPVAAAMIEVVGGSADGRTGVVGSDGTFSIDQLPAGALTIRIRHPDYPTKELEVTAGDGRQRVRLRLPLGGSVEGAAIEEASAAPLASVTITAAGPGGATAEATTDRLGRFRLGPLAPGAWKLALRLAGFLPVSRAVDVTAGRTPGQTTVRDIRLELARGATVGGTVRDLRGQRVSGATVRVVPLRGGTAVEGTTDSLGEFTIKDAPTGDVTVIATKGDLSGSSRLTLRAGDEVRSAAIEVR